MAKQNRFRIDGPPTCRIVYPNGLHKKSLPKGVVEDEKTKPKYNAWLLVPKSDKAKIDQITKAYMEVFEQLKNTQYFDGTDPWEDIDRKQNCWIDGDKLSKKEGKEAFKGYVILKASMPEYRPKVTDIDGHVITGGVPWPNMPVEDESTEELKGGDYVLAFISFWQYSYTSYQGIGMNIHGIKKIRDGERIGGGELSDDEMFGDADYK